MDVIIDGSPIICAFRRAVLPRAVADEAVEGRGAAAAAVAGKEHMPIGVVALSGRIWRWNDRRGGTDGGWLGRGAHEERRKAVSTVLI